MKVCDWTPQSEHLKLDFHLWKTGYATPFLREFHWLPTRQNRQTKLPLSWPLPRNTCLTYWHLTTRVGLFGLLGLPSSLGHAPHGRNLANTSFFCQESLFGVIYPVLFKQNVQQNVLIIVVVVAVAQTSNSGCCLNPGMCPTKRVLRRKK